MESNFNIEEIEAYLEGNLQGTALTAFETRLREDSSLADKVALLRKVDHAIGNEKAIEVQKTIQDIGNDFFNENTKAEAPTPIRHLPFYRHPLAIAASFLLILSLAFVVWSQFNKAPLTNQELYATYYSPYQASNATRGENTTESLYHQAIQQYQAKDFPAAIRSLQEYIRSNPTDMQAIYTLSHSYLNTTPPDYDAASKTLLKIIQDGKSIQLSKAQWYLALIQLKQENITQAKVLLNKLVVSQDDKMAAQAKALLQKINAR